MIMRHRPWFGVASGLASGLLFLLSRDMGPYGPLVLLAPIPLLLYAFDAPGLAVLFGAANILLLAYRIRVEEDALRARRLAS